MGGRNMWLLTELEIVPDGFYKYKYVAATRLRRLIVIAP